MLDKEAALPVIEPLLVMYPLGFVALYGVKPRAVVTCPEVSDKVPPNVSEPLPVTVPVRVNPETVPVPPTEVTVPVVLDVPAPIAVRNAAASRLLTVLSALMRGKLIAATFVSVNRFEPSVVAPRLVRAAAAVVAPVPPLATATVPVTLAEVPVVFWLPAVFTPGRLMFAEPLKLTPPIVRAVCSVVAVAALPVVEADEPVTEMPHEPEAPTPVRLGA